MPGLLLCTDLDRTLIPNGVALESADARPRFSQLVQRPELSLVYVSGRHKALVDEAIVQYGLPQADFIIGDVGSTIYSRDGQPWSAWQQHIGPDWAGHSRADLHAMFEDISALRLQPAEKQNRYKLSYYVTLGEDQQALMARMHERLHQQHIKASLIWSIDEAAAEGLLDVLPASASKYQAVRFLMQQRGFDLHNTVFAGDSGNDLDVLVSPVPAVLVANAEAGVCEQAQRLARERGTQERLYIAQGDFLGMNGNYSAGILEGFAHYHAQSVAWMNPLLKEGG